MIIMTLSYLRYVLAIFAGIQLASGQSLSGQQVLKSQDIPDGQVVTLDPSWFSDDTTDGTTILIDGSDLSVIIPVGQSVDPPPAFLDYNRDIAHQSLPPLLSLFGVDDSEIPALVEEAIPITYGSLTTLFAHGNNSNSPQFCTHGIFADASAWIDKVVSKASNVVKSHTTDSSCALFGAVLTPGFEGVANLFTTLNFISIQAPTTNDQDFYIYPLYNSISHDDGITVCYNAIFPPFFEILGPVDAVTMNKTIYVKDTVSSRNYGDLQFTHGTRILLHEFTHIKQYKALGYTRWAFGARYLFQFCKVRNIPARSLFRSDADTVTGKIRLFWHKHGG